MRGLVEGRRGLGAFVRRTHGEGGAADAALRTELARWLARTRRAGLEEDGITALFTAVLTGSNGNEPNQGNET